MAFCFKKKERIPKAIRRLCCERIDEALESLRRGDHLEGVHQVRKEIKKLRAISRLFRGEMGKGAYRKKAKALRNAATRLTAMRDAHVKLTAFEDLIHHFSRRLSARPFPKIKKALRQSCRDEERKFLRGDSVAVVDRILTQIKNHANDLKTESGGWEAVCPGVNKSYCRGREALEMVRKEPSPENFHEWRKRVKDLWYQLRLLCQVWPKELRAATDELKALSEYIGDDHDLVMLKEFIAERFEQAVETKELDELICLRQKGLRSAALKLGARFYSEKSNRFCGRLGKYWKIWRDESKK